MNQRTPKQVFLEGQLAHALWLLILLAAFIAGTRLPGFERGAFLGRDSASWAYLAVGNAVLHQLYVWFCWRYELASKGLTRLLKEDAFRVYARIFFVFLALRPILAFSLGWSNRGTLPISPLLGYTISALLFVPVAFLMYSLIRYFGVTRAAGLDHFDETIRDKPMVTKGLYRFTANAQYTYGFFALWIPAFLFQSVAALVVAAFSHAFIWVHYFCTEKPDMKRIYGSLD